LQKKIVQLKRDISFLIRQYTCLHYLEAATQANADELASLISENLTLRQRVQSSEYEILTLEEQKSKHLQDISTSQSYAKDLEEKATVQNERWSELQADYENLSQQSGEQVMLLNMRVQQLESELQLLTDSNQNPSLKGGI
jgi:chromosome segregation ATPase